MHSNNNKEEEEISIDIQSAEIRDRELKIEGMFKSQDGVFSYNILSNKKQKTVDRNYVIEQNFLALISFYESKLRFKDPVEIE